MGINVCGRFVILFLDISLAWPFAVCVCGVVISLLATNQATLGICAHYSFRIVLRLLWWLCFGLNRVSKTESLDQSSAKKSEI